MRRRILWMAGVWVVCGSGCAASDDADGAGGSEDTAGSEAGGDGGPGPGSSGNQEGTNDDDDDDTGGAEGGGSTAGQVTTFGSASRGDDDDDDDDDDDTGGDDDDDDDTGATTGGQAGCEGFGMEGLLLWSSLDDAASVASPEVGVGAGTLSTNPADDFVPALDGNGVQIDAVGEYLRFVEASGGTANIDLTRGTVDFCYRPDYDHLDSLNHGMVSVGDLGGAGGIRIRKAAGNNGNALQVIAIGGGQFNEANIPSNAYSLVPGTWYRITVSWDFTVAADVDNTHVYIDGNEVVDPNAPTGPVPLPAANPGGFLYVGSVSDGDPMWNSAATVDDFKVYDAPLVP